MRRRQVESHLSAWGLAAAVAVFLGGCGESGPPVGLVPVTGTVSYEGEPLTSGTVTFVPQGQSGHTAAGDIDGSGKYTLSTFKPGDGAAPGQYRVMVQAWNTPPSANGETMQEMKAKMKSAIPKRFSSVETSGLTATVEDGSAPQTFDFPLTESR